MSIQKTCDICQVKETPETRVAWGHVELMAGWWNWNRRSRDVCSPSCAAAILRQMADEEEKKLPRSG